MISKRERDTIRSAIEAQTALLEWLLVTHPHPGRSRHVHELEVTISDLCRAIGIRRVKRCPGEAHSNPHVDNCGRCAPRWGWIECDVGETWEPSGNPSIGYERLAQPEGGRA